MLPLLYLDPNSRSGKKVTTGGKRVITMSAAKRGMKKGKQALAILVDGMPVILFKINRFIPNGGVSKPIIRLRTMTRPKCNGSIPTFKIKGVMVGTKMPSAAMLSIKHPIMSKKMFSNKSTTRGLVLIPVINSNKIIGVRLRINTQP